MQTTGLLARLLTLFGSCGTRLRLKHPRRTSSLSKHANQSLCTRLWRARRHFFASTACKSGLPCDPPQATLTRLWQRPHAHLLRTKSKISYRRYLNQINSRIHSESLFTFIRKEQPESSGRASARCETLRDERTYLGSLIMVCIQKHNMWCLDETISTIYT